MSDNPNTPAISRGIGSEISDFFQPARRTLSPALELPLDYLKYLQDMGAAGGYGLYGGASDLSGLGASILGFPEMGDKLFEQADKNYDRAGNFLSQSTDDLYGVDLGVPRPDFVPDDYVPGTVVGDGAGGGASRPMPEDDVEFGIGEQLEKEIAALLPVSRKMDADAQDIESAAADLKSQKAKDFRASERNIARSQGMMSQQEQVDDAFMSALKDFTEAAGKKDEAVQGETREDALARYKKEFEDATGIDASGKVDKSKALMAFGLALMQNKAGKGFNVGKILGAVSEAGEAAMPALDKAIDRASAAKLAAGKYALQQIKSGESAAAALDKESREFQKERYFERLKHENALELEEIKAGGKPVELKNVKVDKVINGLEVQRGRGPSGSAFAFPEDALRDSTGALTAINGALDTVDVMNGLATQIANEGSPTLSLIKESAQSVLVGAGLVDANVAFGETGIGKRQQIRLLQDSIITQFKRLLTQETGNGISKGDVDNIKEMLGRVDLLGNPQEAIARLNEIKTLFVGKRTAVRGVLDELQDPNQYPTQAEFERNMELLPTLLTTNTQYSIKKSGDQSSIDVSD